MNLKAYLAGFGLAIFCVSSFAADTVKVTRSVPIISVNATNRTSGASVVTSDSPTNEYQITTLSLTSTNGGSFTYPIGITYLATPTVVSVPTVPSPGVWATSTILVTPTVSSLIVSNQMASAGSYALPSTTIGMKFLIYGIKRQGVIQ